MVTSPSLPIGVQFNNTSVKFGSTATVPPVTEPQLAIELDVSPDIHVFHTTTDTKKASQQGVTLKGRVQLEGHTDADASAETDHPLLVFFRHLVTVVKGPSTPLSPSPHVPPAQSEATTPAPNDSSTPLSPLQQIMRDVVTAFSQLKGRLRLNLDVDAHQLNRALGGPKSVETVAIPEANVSGVKGRLHLDVSLAQAKELVTLIDALNHPEQAQKTADALRTIVKDGLSLGQRIQLGISRFFHIRRWEHFIIRQALEARLNGLLPHSQLSLYRPTWVESPQ